MSRTALEISIWGTHPVEEALSSSDARVHEILYHGKEPLCLGRARERRVPVRLSSREGITQKVETDKHQNIAARVSLDVWDSMRDWWGERPEEHEKLILALDGVQDPQNLGSLIRSAHFFGADALLVTRDRVAPITGVVAKASAGALFSLPIVRATNLAREMEWLGEAGVFRVALDQDGERPLGGLDLKGRALALVIGGEGEGIRPLTVKRCDATARLTAQGGRDSLNAAVAGAVALYEVCRQRAKS